MRTNLKVWLIRNQLQSGKVAEDLEITPSYFSQIVSGNKNPSMELLNKFHDLYANTEGAEDIYNLFRNM